MRASRAPASATTQIGSLGAGFVVFGSMVLLSVEPVIAAEPCVLGYWKHVHDHTGDALNIFKLYEHQGKLFGRIEKTFCTPEITSRTLHDESSASRTNEPLVGSIFFREFVRDEKGPKKWFGGKITDPGDGKVYDAELELSEDGRTLKVFGYINGLSEGRSSSTWSRPTTAELKDL